jgi:L-ribulose-5-phosphate 4-epimerase
VTELQIRKQIIATALRMNALAINRGKSGNVSARWKKGFLVTPSALPYEDMQPADIAFIDAEGRSKGIRKPSSEWRFHFDIYRHKHECQAVVHTHSSFATTLACLGMGVPAFHYMVAVAGGNDIRCAPYATFGTQALSDHAIEALEQRAACLLANHGMIATGSSLTDALRLAVEVEALCEQYWRALQIKTPNLLSDEEMALVVEKFAAYNLLKH